MEKQHSTAVPTHNDLPASTRKELSKLLNQLLANASDIYSHAKQAHWNVRGKDFFSLHELFDKVSQEVLEHADEIAERAGQLGYSVSGTNRQAARATQLEEYPLDIASGEEHVEALATSLGQYNKYLRAGIKEADDAEDAVTTDILTRLCGSADKMLWFVESHGIGRSEVRKKAAA
jgi:starvation-inducible DNA-binding protein